MSIDDDVPVRHGIPASPRSRRWLNSKTLEASALPIAWVIVIVIFGALMPTIFLTKANFSSILASQAVLVVVHTGLAVVLTLRRLRPLGRLGCRTLEHGHRDPEREPPAAGRRRDPVRPLAGLAVGVVNGLFVVLLQIDSLIVTLGMGTFVSGIVLWISHSNTISGISNNLVKPVIVWRLLGIPLKFDYAMIVAVVIWYVFRYTPVGRRLLVVGRAQCRPTQWNPGGHRPLGGVDDVQLDCGVRRRPLHRHVRCGGPDIGPGVAATGLRRRLPRCDHHQSRQIQSMGNRDRGLLPGYRHHGSATTRCRELRAESLLTVAPSSSAVSFSQIVRRRRGAGPR